MSSNVEDALSSASILDLVTVSSPDYGTLHLAAHVDEGGDGICWETVNVEDKELLLLHMKTKLWVAPMLRDVERNTKYEQAINQVIKSLPEGNRLVLDIGTGTGLLSMMAMRAGAEAVVAVEMFPWVFELAKSVIARNTDVAQNVIKVICAHSTDLEVVSNEEQAAHQSESPNSSPKLDRKADILISELLDSTLLREGVLPTVRDAWSRLLNPGAKVLPSGARIWAAVVESKDIRRMHSPSNTYIDQVDLSAASLLSREENSSCGGTRTEPVRIQSLSDMVWLSEPFVVFDFDFSSPDTLPSSDGRCRTLEIDMIAPGSSLDIVYWWDAVLCDGMMKGDSLDECGSGGSVVYSTNPKTQSWQDHWLHAAHPLSSEGKGVIAGETVKIDAYHDETEVWFMLSEQESTTEPPKPEPSLPMPEKNKKPRLEEPNFHHPKPIQKPMCDCGFHALYDTKHIEQVGSRDRLSLFSSAIKQHVESLLQSDSVTSLLSLDVSEGSYLSLLTSIIMNKHSISCSSSAQSTSTEVQMQCVSLEETVHSSLLWGQFVKHHSAAHATDDKDMVDILLARASQVDISGIDLLLFDGFVKGMEQLPLLSMLHFYRLNQALNAGKCLSDKARVVPHSARVICEAYSCPQIIASYGPIGKVCGFDHRDLDSVLENIFRVPLTSDEDGVATPLYLPMCEYSHAALPNTRHVLATFDFKNLTVKDGEGGLVVPDDPNSPLDFASTITMNESADVLVFWVEYDLGFGNWFTTGPAVRAHKQAIRLLRSESSPHNPIPYESSTALVTQDCEKQSVRSAVEAHIRFSNGLVEVGAF